MNYKSKAPNTTITRDMVFFSKKTGNVYESIRIIGKRANQITVDVKRHLEKKIIEFSSYPDNLNESGENKERIEISRFFEHRPKSTLLAIQEFVDNNIYFRYPGKEAETKKIEIIE